VFVALDKLLAKKGKDRIKDLKENAGRALTAAQAKPVEEAKTVEDLAAALDGMVDERGSPKKRIAASGTPILQPTGERRRTGSHYTPRSLTAPIVKYALEPAFDRLGPDATPEQVLDMKVCDPAMGSGAFLVEACRAIGERLVAAWSRWPQTRPKIPADEDEDLHARRLVAQRCLYGVDKNPRAVDLARLSLWLATLARDHEFIFLDHALKCGDSLVGLTTAQIAAVNWDESKPSLPLFRQLVHDSVAKTMKGRAEIQNAPDDTMRAVQEARHRNLESEVAPIRMMGDAVVSAFFAADKPKAREKARADVESHISGMKPRWDLLEASATKLRSGAHGITPFHWQIEFPEVFARGNGGFDAIVGNPPFAGKNTIIGGSAKNFLPWLQTLHVGAHGNADLVAHFFRRAFGLLRPGGVFGLIATNTIGQGDTRASGLTKIIADGGAILRATRRLKWPGEAAVVVSVVHMIKGEAVSPVLDGQQVHRVSAYLVEGHFDGSPHLLVSNSRRVFQGTNPVGPGFLIDDARAQKGETTSTQDLEKIIEDDNSLSSYVKPFVSGEDVANHVEHLHTRQVIDFGDLSLEDSKRLGGKLFAVIQNRVYPVRSKDNREHRRLFWWQHGEPQKGLYAAIASNKHVIVCPQTGPHLAFARRENFGIYASTVMVFALSSFSAPGWAAIGRTALMVRRGGPRSPRCEGKSAGHADL
jgi:hypothetical protein